MQLWAYTRMSIRKCPKPKETWKEDVQFPLFKTWQKRLLETPALSTMKEVRRQLNNLKPDGGNHRITYYLYIFAFDFYMLPNPVVLMSPYLRQLQFIWQPYSGFNKKFHSKLSKVDRSLIGSSTVLVFYWVVERHNTWQVMKQFGLKQLVPPPFTMPI